MDNREDTTFWHRCQLSWYPRGMHLSEDFLQRVWIATYAAAFDRERETAPEDRAAAWARARADEAAEALARLVADLPAGTAFPSIPGA